MMFRIVIPVLSQALHLNPAKVLFQSVRSYFHFYNQNDQKHHYLIFKGILIIINCSIIFITILIITKMVTLFR